MARLAKQQACQLFIEQEIEKGLKDGKTHRSIGREISAMIKKFFEGVIDPETIRKRADRIANGTNVPPELTPQEQTTISENQDEVEHGGAREGAGRPTNRSKETNALSQLQKWWMKSGDRTHKSFLNWLKEREEL